MAIYFIGGASGAGKTSASKLLAANYGIPALELDDLQRLIMPALQGIEQRAPATRNIAAAMLNELLRADARCIVEGSWLEPEEAGKLRSAQGKAFHPVYCGYHDRRPEERYEMLRTGGRHWLTRETAETAFAFLERQVEHSDVYRERCSKLAIAYFDFTSIAEGNAALEADFGKWFQLHG